MFFETLEAARPPSRVMSSWISSRSYFSSVPRSEGALDERCSEALALALADALRHLVSDVRRALDA